MKQIKEVDDEESKEHQLVNMNDLNGDTLQLSGQKKICMPVEPGSGIRKVHEGQGYI